MNTYEIRGNWWKNKDCIRSKYPLSQLLTMVNIKTRYQIKLETFSFDETD